MFDKINENKKQEKALYVIALFILVATLIGVAVAAYTWSFTGTKTSTITSGNISMSFLESSDTIAITDALPVSDNTGKAYTTTDHKFDFAVTTYAAGTPGTINYNLSITKVVVDDDYTAFNDNQVKVYLAALDNLNNETQVMAPTLVSNIITSGDTGILIFDAGKSGYLSHDHNTANTSITQKYRFKMWIDSQVDASNWTASTKYQYKLKINSSGTIS